MDNSLRNGSLGLIRGRRTRLAPPPVVGYARSLLCSGLHLWRTPKCRAMPPILGATLDLVTVVFEPELDLLALQARSFERFLDPAFAGRILVIVNDLRWRRVIDRIEAGVLPHYGRWRDRVTIVPFHAIAYRLDPSNGWIVQQVLKLACAQMLTQPHYVVFDAKNHLIAPTALDRFVDADGRARQAFAQGTVHLPRHDETCAQYFGLDPHDAARPRFAPMTPFALHTQTARDLIAHIEAREERRFSSFFCRRPFLSEFLLYGAYLDAHADGAASRYRDVACETVTVWPEDDLAALVEEARTSAAFCFGVHRNHLARIGTMEAGVLATHWRRIGLLGDAEAFGGLAGARVGAGSRLTTRVRGAARGAPVGAGLVLATISFCMLVTGGPFGFTTAGAALALLLRSLLRLERAAWGARLFLRGAALSGAVAMASALVFVLSHGFEGRPRPERMALVPDRQGCAGPRGALMARSILVWVGLEPPPLPDPPPPDLD